MKYQADDWKTEAPRIEAAFGIEKDTFVNGALSLVGNYYVSVEYKPDYRYYKLTDSQYFNIYYADIKLWSDGSMEVENYSDECAFDLAKGLYCLEALTPEIEAALEVTISAHEKAEWLLEFESRLEIMQ